MRVFLTGAVRRSPVAEVHRPPPKYHPGLNSCALMTAFVGKIESGERQLNVLEFCEYADVLERICGATVVEGKG
jgi:hypothetical protein